MAPGSSARQGLKDALSLGRKLFFSFFQRQGQPLTGSPSNQLPSQTSAQPDTFLRFQQRPPATRFRPGYARVPSVSFVDENEGQEAELANRANLHRPGTMASGNGLGIALPESLDEADITITHFDQKYDNTSNIMASPEQVTPGSAKPLMSPPSTAGLSGTTQYDSPYNGFDTKYKSTHSLAKQSHASLQSTHQPSIYANSEAGLLSVRSRYDSFAPEHHCQSVTHIKGKRLSWLSLTILVLAVYSTVMAAIFFYVAAKGPRYGRNIRTGGRITISGATVLTTFFAKTIELSFVTVIVALLGQALARRAHDKKAESGITLAELGMRSWILQPGTLITHWEGVRYAGVTVLGILSLLSAVLAMLYVTAANALVQPQLKFNNPGIKSMQGLVKTSFANPAYIMQQCETPITAAIDPTDLGPTCMQLEHAGKAFHNYYAYLSTWSAFTKAGNGSADLQNRPQGYATLNDTTKVHASWIDQQYGNMTELFDTYGHIIVNISMAMPHAGVIAAARDPINNIMQPEDLDGQGLYRIQASVPSPVVHVTCAMLSKDYLRPLVADLANDTLSEGVIVPALNTSDVYRGGTSLDDIFGWGSSYGLYAWPPVFERLPLGHNTMVNDTLGIPYGRDSIYLLGNSSIESTPGAILSDPPVDTFIYPLCKIRVSQTPYCSTWYNASSSGGTLAAHCEDDNNHLTYIKSLSNATSGRGYTNNEWPNIAGELFKSLALNDGIVNGNGTNSRVLTQLTLQKPQLDPSLPSIAEALAVMAGSTLLQSTKDAPFVEFFNYTAPSNIMEGKFQYFNASVEAQQYASGGTAAYQRAFLVILFAVFLLDFLALAYFLTHRDWYADVSEPSNLFSLAINSPPSKELAGSCGGGPHGKQFRSSWKLQEDGGHVYMESTDGDTASEDPGLRRRRRLSEGFDMMMSPVRKTTSRFSTATTVQ